jgi:hypothetical protein
MNVLFIMQKHTSQILAKHGDGGSSPEQSSLMILIDQMLIINGASEATSHAHA